MALQPGLADVPVGERVVLVPEEMRQADRYAMEQLGVASIVLMENAARSAYEILRPMIQQQFTSHTPTALFLCGPGNNGGDGFALARHLSRIAVPIVCWIGDESKMTPETRANLESLRRLGVQVHHLGSEEDFQHIPVRVDILVDALLGIGGSGNPHGLIRSLLQYLAESTMSPAMTVAIDVPTGVDAETGKAIDVAIRADVTITMGALKTGLLINDGPQYSGRVFVANLGVPIDVVARFGSRAVVDLPMARSVLHTRLPRTTKKDYGTVAVIGGHRTMPGAVALAANAAIAAGAGLVKLYAPALHSQIKPEVITIPLHSDEEGVIARREISQLIEAIQATDAVILGPGLGRSKAAQTVAQQLLSEILKLNVPVLIDADGLRAVPAVQSLHSQCVVTPHLGEFCMMTGSEYPVVRESGLWLAEQWAQKWQCVVVLKDVPAFITDGQRTFLHTQGNPGMATAGSGDVLSGIIGALLAQGYEPLTAATLGVTLHRLAGQLYVERWAYEPLTASALIDFLPQAFATLHHHSEDPALHNGLGIG